MAATYFYGGITPPPVTPGVVKAYRYKKMGQSPAVGAAPIDPNPNNAQSVAFNSVETLSGGALSRVTPSLFRKFKWVHIFNNTASAWQPYEVRVNAQGFNGSELGGGYVPGFCSYLPLAHWWEENMAGQHLFLEKAGAVGQEIDKFMAAYGDGQNNVFHQVANTTWIPAENKLPAYAQSLSVTETHVLGYEWTHGEAENTTTVGQYASKLQQLLIVDLAPYWPRTAGEDILVVTPTIYSQAVTIAPAVNAQKAQFIANTPRAVTHPDDQVTLLSDVVHWGCLGMWVIGFYYLPEALGLAAPRNKYFYYNLSKSPSNTVNTRPDEGGAYNDIVAVAGKLPIIVTDASSGDRVYAIGNTAAKMVVPVFGGMQQVDRRERTEIYAVQQPVTTQPQYLKENNSNSVAPGYNQGSTASLNANIGGAQDTTTLTVLTYELTRTSTTYQDGNGLLSVYRNNVLKGSGPCLLSRLDGSGLAFYSPFDDTYASLAAQPGTYDAGIIMYPGVSAARRNAEYNSLLTQITLGDTISPAAGNQPPPTATDQEPTGPYTDETVAPAETGMFVSGGALQAPPAISTQYATGLVPSYLAAGMSGGVGQRFAGSDSYGATIGLNTVPKRTAGTNTTFSFQISPDNNGVAMVSPAYMGTPATSSAFGATVGLHYRIKRIGATGRVYIEESQDNTGTSWTVKFQYAQTSTADLYPVANLATLGAKLYGLRTQSMSPANIALANNGLLQLNVPVSPSTTRGGFASFGTAGIATSGGFAFGGIFNITQVVDAIALLINQGFSGGPDESSLIQLIRGQQGNTTAELYARVRDAAGSGFAIPQTIPFVFGTEVFIALEAVAGVCRLHLNDTTRDANYSFSLPQVTTDFLVGGGRNTDGTAAFSMIGSVRDVFFATRTSLLTTQEISDYRASSVFPAGTTRASSLRRQYISDLYSPDAVSPANPVLILDGGGQ